MGKDIFLHRQYSIREINLVDSIVSARPKPNRRFDQIYMKAGDMLKQLYYIEKNIGDKDIVFLGDDDCMSLLIGVFVKEGLIGAPKSMTVLDFDQRILKNINEQADYLEIRKYVPIYTEAYNVIDKIRVDKVEKFNYFYINPPFGAFNEGLSCIIWLHRCIEMCKEFGAGCVIIPYSSDSNTWKAKSMHKVQCFLTEKGFVIERMALDMHTYHVDDMNLTSATILVNNVKKISSEYSQKDLPLELVKNLYGKTRAIPRYIKDENELDSNWQYGRLRNFLIPPKSK